MLGVAVAALFLGASPGAAQQRPSCEQVNSEVNRIITHRKGGRAGIVAVAKKLKTDEAWVERCMLAYGRIPAADSRISDDERERLQEALETGEPVIPSDSGDQLDPQEDTLYQRPERNKRRLKDFNAIRPRPNDPHSREFLSKPED